jgi:hypothetical protein
MSRNWCLGLVVTGAILILLTFVFVACGSARAEDVTGTWTSTVAGEGYFDSTYPADFHYDATLTLNVGGSGSIRLTCSDVDINQPGWESALDGIGKVSTYSLGYTVFGSSVTLKINDGMGGTISLAVTVTGNRMTGSGSYTDRSYVTNSWEMDLTRGGGGSASIGLPGLGGIASAAAIGGFLVGFIVSFLPPPRYMGGSILPQSQTALGTPYAPSQSVVLDHRLSSIANQPGGVTRPLPDVPRMRMQFDPIQFPNVEMGRTTDVRPTDVHPTDVLSKRACPNCGSTLIVTAGGWSCPFCNRAPPGGLSR